MAVKFDFALTDAYTSRITDLNDTYKALAKFDLAGTEDGIPTNAKRWNGTTNKFEIWNGASWSTLSNIPYIDTANTFTSNQNITGNLSITGSVSVDAINEKNAGNGVAVDGVELKDGGGVFSGDVLITGDLSSDNNISSGNQISFAGSSYDFRLFQTDGSFGILSRDSSGDGTPFFIQQGNYTKKNFFMTSDGKISTGGETSPDVLAGGIHIKGPSSGTGNLLKAVYNGSEKFTVSHSGGISGNSLNISNGITASFINTDEWACGQYSEFTGDNTVDTTESTGSSGYMIMDLTKSTPVPPRDFNSDDNIFVIKNNGSTKHIFKGDGDIYTDTGSVSAYDVEDDIMLVETVRNSFDNKKVLKQYKTRLEELGIMKNGFMSHNKMHSLNLGAIGQLWNIIKSLGKELGYDDKQLLEFSKHY